MSGFLVVNPSAGSSRPTAGELRTEAEAHGVQVHVLEPGDDPAELARRADADLRALVLTSRARARHPAKVLLDGAPIEASIVLVANNAYRVDLFSIGARERVDTGLLHLYVASGPVPTAWEEREGPAFTLD